MPDAGVFTITFIEQAFAKRLLRRFVCYEHTLLVSQYTHGGGSKTSQRGNNLKDVCSGVSYTWRGKTRPIPGGGMKAVLPLTGYSIHAML